MRVACVDFISAHAILPTMHNCFGHRWAGYLNQLFQSPRRRRGKRFRVTPLEKSWRESGASPCPLCGSRILVRARHSWLDLLLALSRIIRCVACSRQSAALCSRSQRQSSIAISSDGKRIARSFNYLCYPLASRYSLQPMHRFEKSEGKKCHAFVVLKKR